MKKDVLFICQFYSPEYVTSAELAADTCRGMASAGLSVDVLCGYPGEYIGEKEKVPTKETEGGVNIKRLRYIHSSRKSVFGRLLNYFSFYFAVLMRLFSMGKYRVVAAYSNPPMVTNILNLASKLFKVKTVFIAHDVYPEIAVKTGKTGENSLMAKTMRRINGKLSKNLDGVICISEEMADFFEKERDISRDRIAYIPNWHRDLYDGEKEKADGSPFVCGYLGNMGICQDMETVVSAIEKQKDSEEISYVFAGHGTKAEDIRSRLSGAANVKNLGFLRGKEFSDTLGGCDACVVSLEPGLGGLCAPSKVYSYYMMGKPVIAVTDEKDIGADIEKYNCGIVVKNGDAEGFYAAVKRLAGDPALRKEMGKNARRCYLENYTESICCGRIAAFIKKLAEEDRKG
ncbi:MAG: glycosyltransferase family 4 protein [Clostridia bacterium]|nr:glycosyltransferase family 4 protein [Clostridia bacterium]